MIYKILCTLCVCLLLQTFVTAVDEEMTPEQMVAYQESIIRQLNESVQNSVNTILDNIKTYNIMMQNMTDEAVAEDSKLIKERIQKFKEEIIRAKTSSGEDVVIDCLIEEGQLDVIEEQINNEVKICTTTIMQEVVNVISDSLNQAQMFMTIPEVIGKDIQRCGFTKSCLQTIVADAISESLQVPPKVMTIAARIQQMNLRSVVSIDACLLNSLKKVTKMGFDILQDVFYCIQDSVNAN